MNRYEWTTPLNREEILERLQEDASVWSERKFWTKHKTFFFRMGRKDQAQIFYTGHIFGAVRGTVQFREREGESTVRVDAGIAPISILCVILLLLLCVWLAVLDITYYGVTGLGRDLVIFIIGLLGLRETLRNRRDIPVLTEYIRKRLENK